MARYGGGSEDFNAQKARLDAISARLTEINAKEIAAEDSLNALGEAERRGGEATRRRAQAKREATNLDAREARVMSQDASAVNADTAAIERNARMRQRRSQIARQEAVDLSRAQQGARDPLFGRAAALGPDASQYKMRRELGIGSTRARAMQDALIAGFRPGGPDAPHGPPVRATAALNAERQFMATLTAEEQAYVAATRGAAQFAQARAPQRSLAMASALQREGTTLGTVSQAMHRHGALTSEFILATARGETTLREIGNQALITAGKFGGWTAAATGIFAVAGALAQVGHGAIAAQSGVHTLDRVLDRSTYTGDQAQQAFNSLSREFNVSPDVAIDAIYRMGQRFHSFPEAVKAARASLYSFKTGEVDVATSTENLIAVVNGFGLSADDLTSVYDQINQAQNTFGIRIADTEAGLAKAAGTYHNAGGDLNYLLAVMTAIGRATNRSGQEIGTGIARAVNQIRKPLNIGILKAQGVEVDPRDFQKTLQSALKAAKRPGADLQQIATGLFGPQYARLIAPVLADQRILNKALADTSPEKSKGSAQKELAKVLHQADEQIKRLGFSLQQLGAALNRAGAFVIAGVFLTALNSALDIAVFMVETFDKIPQPFRDALTVIAQIAVAMKLMQRLGGESLAGGRLAFLANPDAQFATRTKRGLRDSATAAKDEAERAQGRAYTISHAASTANLEAARLEAEMAQRQAAAVTGGTEAKRAAVNAEALYVQQVAKAERLAAQAAAASEAAADARALAAAADAQSAEAAAMSAAEMRAYAEARRLAIPAEGAVPSTKGTVTAGHQMGLYPVGAGGVGQAEAAVKDAERKAATIGTEVNQLERLSTRGAAVQLMMARNYGHLGGKLESAGATGRVVNRVAERGITTAGRAVTTVERMGRGIGGLATRLRGFASALGPLDIALAGFFGIEFVMNKLESTWQKAEDQQRALTNRTGTLEHLHRQRTLANQATQEPEPPMWGRMLGGILGGIGGGLVSGGVGTAAGTAVGAKFGGDFINDAIDHISGRYWTRQAAKTDQDTFRRIQRAQHEAQARGTFIPMLTADQLVKRVDRDAQMRRAGLIGQREFDSRMRKHALEARTLWEPNQKELQAALSAIAGANRQQGRGAAYRASLKKLDPKGLQTESQAVSALIDTFGPTRANIQRLRDVYAESLRRFQGKNDAETIIALSKMREETWQAIQQSAQSELTANLAYARTEGQRRTAYSQAQRTLRTGILTDAKRNVSEAQKRVSDARARQNRLRDRAERGPEQPQHQADPFGLGPLFTGDPVEPFLEAQGDLNRKAEAAKKDMAKAKRQLAQAKKDRDAAERKFKEAQAELRDAAYSDREQGRQINLAYSQSFTGDTHEQAAQAVAAAKRQVEDARRTYGLGSRQYKQAITTLHQAENQLGQSVLADTEANNALLLARAGSDPLAQAAAQVQAAANTLAATRATKRVDPNAVKQAQANLISAQTAQADAIRQEHQQVQELFGQIEAARLSGPGGDALAAARASLRAAKRAQAFARTHVERLQALLAVIQANNAVEEAMRDQEQARYELLAAQNAEDPVQVANIERRAAAAALKGTHGAARLRAKAAYIRARDASRAAALQSKEDDIDFEQQMGRIDVQDAIDRYQALLKTKHLTQQQKRDLRLKIHGLQQEMESEASGFDLDVGNLKLPTIFDVRKAFDPIRSQIKNAHKTLSGIGDAATASSEDADRHRGHGRGARGGEGGGGYHVSHHVTDAARTLVQARINVYVRDGRDADKVYDAIDRAMGTHVKSKLRSRHHRRAR